MHVIFSIFGHIFLRTNGKQADVRQRPYYPVTLLPSRLVTRQRSSKWPSTFSQKLYRVPSTFIWIDRLVLNARRISVLIYGSLFKFWLVHFYMMSILNMLHRSFWYMTVHIQAFESFNLKPKIYPFYPGTFTLKQKYLIFEFFPSKI